MVDEKLLKKVYLFQNLDRTQFDVIMGLLKPETFAAGTKIVEEGIAGDALYILLSGKIKISRRFGQETFLLTELGPYDFFGEMSLIDDYPASATVEALQETSVLRMTREDFKALVSSNSELSAKLWESLARSLNMKIRKTGDLVKMYYGLNRALCENAEFRELYTSWNFHIHKP